ncbi:addiction module protein [Sorangium sp. So ce291]|uniref:addiction module protein n=1 Tax=Sorangium sp. So ce291 TaxID=3133294 RepID=UPI003F5DB98B
MAHPTQDILAAALSLPEGERLRLASELLASVEEPHHDAWNAAWLEELERREQAVRDGGARGTRGPRFARECSRDWALVDPADPRSRRRAGAVSLSSCSSRKKALRTRSSRSLTRSGDRGTGCDDRRSFAFVSRVLGARPWGTVRCNVQS